MYRSLGRFSNEILVALLVTALVWLIGVRLWTSGYTFLNVWGDRDLWRALSVPSQWPFLGPESNGGIRAPGGAFYLILAAILAIGRDTVTVNTAVVVLYAISVAMMGLYFAHKVSPLAGALTAAALASSTIINETLGVWNPGFILIFAAAATVFGYSFLVEGRPLALGLATAALAIGMQVHLQITQVALGLILATLVYRRRITLYHAVAAVSGFVVPYLPNIIFGDARFIQTAASLPGNAIENYVFLDTAQLWIRINLLGDLFGGGIIKFFNYNPYAWSLLLATACSTVIMVAIAAIAIVRAPRTAFSGAPVGFFLFVLFFTTVTALSSDLVARHMVAATPAAAALVGLTAERLMVGLKQRGLVAQVGAAVLCGLFVIRPLLIAVATLASPPFSMASVAAQNEIAATLKPAFYADRNTFEAHVAEFTRNGPHHWLVVSNGISNHISFLYQTFPVANASENRKDCMAIVAKSDAAGDLRNDLAASPSLAGLGATFSEPLTESAHFLYVPYTTRDGNCLKTFPNAYIPTAFEADHLATNAPVATWITDGEVLFVVPQPGHRDPTGVEIRREASGYVAIIHGRLLRGYTGLYFRSIASPILCFADGQDVRPIRFRNITIGSPQRGTLAPWRSPIFRLPDGRYRLWLIGSDGRLPIAVRDFVGELIIPTMEAAAPSPAASEPPAECFGGNRPTNRP